MSSLLHIFDSPATKVTSGTWSADGGAVLNSLYPLTNLDTDVISIPAIFTTNCAWLLYDMGSATRVDLVTLPNFNGDAGLAVTVKMNATNSWGSPSLSVAMTIPGLSADGFGSDPFVDLTGVSGYNTSGYRYLRIEFGTNSVPFKLKVRLSGLKQTFVRNVYWDQSPKVPPILLEKHPMIERTTDAGIVLGYERGTRARWFGGYCWISTAGVTALQTQFRACHGRSIPFLWILDPTSNEAWIARWGQQADYAFHRQYIITNLHELYVDIEEVGRGLKP